MNVASFSRATLGIAVNTFREAVRNRLFTLLLVVGFVAPWAALVFGAMSLHHEERITIDLSIFGSTLVGVALTIYAMVSLLESEIEKRTLYTILSKPISRSQFLLGKYLGVLGLVSVCIVVLLAASSALLLVQGFTPTPQLALAFFLLFLQLAIVSALALLFANFASPLTTGFVVFGLFLLGSLLSGLNAARHQLAASGQEGLAAALGVAQRVLPNFEALNIADLVVYEVPIPPSFILHAVWYTASYSAAALFIAMLIFARRDIA